MKRTRSNAFILKNERAWEPAGEGVVRQILGYDGQVMLVKVKFEQGAVGTPHTHYHTQTNRIGWRRCLYRTGCRTWMHLSGSRYINRLLQSYESGFSETVR